MEKYLRSWNIIWLTINQMQCCMHAYSALFTAYAHIQLCSTTCTRATLHLFHYVCVCTQLCSTMRECTQLCSTTRAYTLTCVPLQARIHMEWFLVAHALNMARLLWFNQLQAHLQNCNCNYKHIHSIANTHTWVQACAFDCERKFKATITSACTRLQGCIYKCKNLTTSVNT